MHVAHAVGRRADDDLDAPGDLSDDGVDDDGRSRSLSRAASPVTPSAVTPLTPAAGNEIDDTLQALDVDFAAAPKRGRQHGKHTFEWHETSGWDLEAYQITEVCGTAATRMRAGTYREVICAAIE